MSTGQGPSKPYQIEQCSSRHREDRGVACDGLKLGTNTSLPVCAPLERLRTPLLLLLLVTAR